MDAYGNTWSEVEILDEILDAHDKMAFVPPQPSNRQSANVMANTANGDQSTNTLPRGNKVSHKELQRKLSDPETRADSGIVSNREGNLPNISAQSPAYKSMSTSGTFSGGLRRDSDASLNSGNNISLATSLNVNSFMRGSPQEGFYKSMEGEGTLETDITRSKRSISGYAGSKKWTSEEGGFDHQTIKKNLLRPGLTIVNPFDPTQTTAKVTSNRRRWTHIFPKGGGSEGHGPGKMQYIDERGHEIHEYQTRQSSVLANNVLKNIAVSSSWVAGFDGYSTIHSGPTRIRRGKRFI